MEKEPNKGVWLMFFAWVLNERSGGGICNDETDKTAHGFAACQNDIASFHTVNHANR